MNANGFEWKKAIAKCKSAYTKIDSTFTFFEFDECNIPDEILSEGNVVIETIRNSVTQGNMDNTPMNREYFRSPHFRQDKQYHLSPMNRISCAALYLKIDDDRAQKHSKDVSSFFRATNLARIGLDQPSRKGSIQLEIRQLLRNLAHKRDKRNNSEAALQRNHLFEDSLISIREIEVTEKCF